MFVLRVRMKNRIVVDALTIGPTDAVLEAWCAHATRQLRRLADEAETNGRRAAGLLETSAGVEGLADAPHDYRWLDAPHLRRRARVGWRVARRLRATAGDRRAIVQAIRSSGDDAAAEISADAVGRLEPADAAMVLSRVDELREQLVVLGRRRR